MADQECWELPIETEDLIQALVSGGGDLAVRITRTRGLTGWHRVELGHDRDDLFQLIHVRTRTGIVPAKLEGADLQALLTQLLELTSDEPAPLCCFGCEDRGKPSCCDPSPCKLCDANCPCAQEPQESPRE